MCLGDGLLEVYTQAVPLASAREKRFPRTRLPTPYALGAEWRWREPEAAQKLAFPVS